ncbi:hypothetical protein AMTR_s00003p00041030 [Amborella trichopoda]|uniref:Uncharacterized protein n=1 Tax=Amborella trichopoda TaxID=13333 RepID=W1P7Y6_AMBTC|nr:hypothetical protein AMTR_s00003p00041030 [Amborella trichopoda]
MADMSTTGLVGGVAAPHQNEGNLAFTASSMVEDGLLKMDHLPPSNTMGDGIEESLSLSNFTKIGKSKNIDPTIQGLDKEEVATLNSIYSNTMGDGIEESLSLSNSAQFEN